MTGKNQHVVPHGIGWAVRGEGNKRATRLARTQKEAIEIAIRIAQNQGSEVLIHGRDGRIRARETYAEKDPFPPRDTEH